VDDEIESCIMTACVPDSAARRSERENVEKRQKDVKQDDESRWSFKTQFQDRKIPLTESFFSRQCYM